MRHRKCCSFWATLFFMTRKISIGTSTRTRRRLCRILFCITPRGFSSHHRLVHPIQRSSDETGGCNQRIEGGGWGGAHRASTCGQFTRLTCRQQFCLFVCSLTQPFWAFWPQSNAPLALWSARREEGNRLRYTVRKWLITIRWRLCRRRLATSSRTPWRYGEE